MRKSANELMDRILQMREENNDPSAREIAIARLQGGTPYPADIKAVQDQLPRIAKAFRAENERVVLLTKDYYDHHRHRYHKDPTILTDDQIRDCLPRAFRPAFGLRFCEEDEPLVRHDATLELRRGFGHARSAKKRASIGLSRDTTKSLIGGEIKGLLALNGQLYVCDVCGEQFPRVVWHCPGCDSHWDMSRDSCSNCYYDRSS